MIRQLLLVFAGICGGLSFVSGQDRATVKFADDGTVFRRICRTPQQGNTYQITVEVAPGNCGRGNYQVEWGDGSTTAITGTGVQRLTKNYNLTSFNNNCATGVLNYNIIITSTVETCIDINIARLIIMKPPVAVPTVQAACEDRSSTFTNASCGRSNADVTWRWEFSDGRTFTTLNVSRTFPNPDQTYAVRLTATLEACDVVSTSEWVSFDLKKLPRTNAEISGIENDVFCFSQNSDSLIVLDASGSENSTIYHWEVTGGAYEIDEVVRPDSSVMRVKLKEAGRYTVAIRARNACGLAPQWFSQTFEAVALPEVSLIPQPDGCESLTYRVLQKIEGATYTLSGAPFDPDQEVELTVSEVPYVVTASYANVCGSRTVSDSFYVYSRQDVSITSLPLDTIICLGSEPLPLRANVSGGNWETESLQIIGGNPVFYPNQTGEFTVIYRRGVGLCLSSDATIVRVINELATAGIGLDQVEARCSPAKITLSNRSEGHDPTYASWNFGEGTDIVTMYDTISHIFIAEGTEKLFTVRLQVKNACGTSQTLRTVKILPRTISPLFTMSTEEACVGVDVNFTDATVPQPQSWLWRFGDGTVSNQQHPVHRFEGNPGTYQVMLITTNQCATDSIVHPVLVTPLPQGDFSIASGLACEGEEVRISNLTDPRYSFEWDFGDGSPVDSVNHSTTHVYGETGTFPIILSLFGSTRACRNEIRKVLLVEEPVVADFSIEADPQACAPALVRFTNQSERSDQWVWDFGNGRTTQVKEPLLPFDPGLYTVTLTASRGGGCANTLEKTIFLEMVDCSVEIPEAFTPNGDKYGDRYTLFGNGISRIKHFSVRNRWGEMIFRMQDVPPGSQQDGESWDGTKDGKPLPADMYVFEAVLVYRDLSESDVIRGKFYLIR